MYPGGGAEDDVAHNIRNEQMADGMPSAEEAEREHREWLAEQGCAFCDEGDPDRLEVQHPFWPSCPYLQRGSAHPRPGFPDTRVVCAEHVYSAERVWWAETLASALEENAAAIVVYECDNTHVAETPTTEVPEQVGYEDGSPVYEKREVEDRRQVPTAPLECPCGAGIDEVMYL